MVEPIPTFDYFPGGTRFVHNGKVEQTLVRTLEEGKPVGVAFDEMQREQVRQLREDPAFRSELREIYREAGVNLFTPTMGSFGGTDLPGAHAEGVRDVLSRWQARFDTLDWMHKITTPTEARDVVRRGDVGVVPNTQNLGLAINGDLEEIERLYNFGIRIAQLTYNSQNLIGAGCTERVDAGLSNHGVDAVERMNELGIVVDLSHCGPRTTLDTIEISDRPVAFTHTFCQELADHDRGKSDEELRALADNDGYMGIIAIPFFQSPDDPGRAFENYFEHLDRAVSILGSDRVGIGTDWGAWSLAARDDLPEILREAIKESYIRKGFRQEHGVSSLGLGFGPMEKFQDWGVIPDELGRRGYDESEIEGIIGGNFLNFWDRVVE